MTNIPLHTIINKNPKSLRRLDSLNIPLISPINLPTIFQKNIGCISWEYIVKILINLSSNSSINLSIIWYLLWKNLLGYWRVFYFEMLLKFFKKFKYLKHFWPVGVTSAWSNLEMIWFGNIFWVGYYMFNIQNFIWVR